MIEKLVAMLENDILTFSELFQAFQLNFDNKYSHFTESKLSARLSRESQDLLLKLKLCQERVQNDIAQINPWLSSKKQLDKKSWFVSNLNLRDCFNTCENTIACYDKFLRKDIKLLKDTFEALIQSIKTLNEKLKEYNNCAKYAFVTIDESFETLNKVVVLGFKITDLKLLTLSDFQKLYPEADTDFVNYLRRKGKLNKKEEWKWLSTLEDYFESLEDD